MNDLGKNKPRLKKPAYRLRQAVSYVEKEQSLYLILSYPLKFIKLSYSWVRVFKTLSTHEFFYFDEIFPLASHTDSDRTEIFLDELVRKGFLERQGIASLSKYPFVSIIVPVYNRPGDIKTCLESIVGQNYPGNRFEIIVIDDASTDHTPTVAAGFPVRLLPLRQNKKAPYCRNMAAQQARGDILAFIDSDCLADPLWLRELVPAFKDTTTGVIGGMVDSYYDSGSLDRYEQVRSSLNMGNWPRRSAKTNPFFYVPSCNLLVRSKLFQRLEGFKEELVVGEDVDLCWRIRKLGYHIEYRPVGKIYHRHRNRLSDFCKRRFDYGTSEPMLQQLHPEKTKQLVFAPGAAIFWSILLLAVIFNSFTLISLCSIPVLAETVIKSARIMRRDIPIRFSALLMAIGRSYFACLYQCCSFVSRYYLVWAIVIIPFLPLTAMTIAGMHFLTGILEFFLKKPQLNLAIFLFYFSVEQLSYQSGVWWECLKKLSFSVVTPRITVPLRET